MMHAILFTFRLLYKNRGYQIVGILGLAIGIASCWFIANYVQHHYTYDKFHSYANRIYRINMAFTAGETTDHFAPTGTPVGEFLAKKYASIESYAKLKFGEDPIVEIKGEKLKAHHFFFANSGIFDVFSFVFIRGDKSSALVDPNTVLITKSMALKYFGHVDVIGEEMIVDDNLLKVTGVFEDWPSNSHLKINALMAESRDHQNYDIQSWFDLEQYNYVLVNPKLSSADLEDLLSQLVLDEIAPELEGLGVSVKFYAERLDQVFFQPGLIDDVRKGNIAYVNTLAIAGLMVLFIAGLNFINLGLSQATRRRKEIGLRRILGISRWQLFRQRSMESFIIMVLVLVAAVILTLVLSPYFYQMAGIEMNINNWPMFGFLSLFIFFSSFFGSGNTSVAVFFSRQPLNTDRKSVTLFRKLLVGIQLAISSIILMATFIVQKQIDYINTKDLGFSSGQVMIINLPEQEEFKNNAQLFKSTLQDYESVAAVSLINGGALPGEENGKELFEVMVNGSKEERVYNIYGVDENYFDLLSIDFALGRSFEDSIITDKTEAVIINQVLARTMQWEQPLGQTIWVHGKRCKVIGVTQNFHNKSLHNVIEPIVFIYDQEYTSNLLLKTTIDQENLVKTLWSQFYTDLPFEWHFFQDQIANMYTSEKQLRKLLTNFAIISIILSCMGVIAIFSIHLQQKTKEMSIRKVFGANGLQLLRAMTKNYFTLTLISVGLAGVVVWLIKREWLNSFIYKVEINPIAIGLLGLFVMLFMVFALTYHLLKLMQINPIDTLKQE